MVILAIPFDSTFSVCDVKFRKRETSIIVQRLVKG